MGELAERSGLTDATATFVRAMRRDDWRDGLQDALGRFAEALGCHRIIVFRLEETSNQGFVQLIDGMWSDTAIAATRERPTEILQQTVIDDPFLRQIATESRHGKVFAGHTRDLHGWLSTLR